MSASGTGELLLIHGEERYFVDRDARGWLDGAREQAFSDLDVEVLDAPARAATVRDALREVPFLAERRSCQLRDPPQLQERVRRGADGADALADAIAQRSPQTALCIVSHCRVAAQNPVLALARAEGRIVEHPRLRGRELRGAAERLAAAAGLRLPRQGLDLLMRVCANDLGVLSAELSKIASFAAGGRQLSLDDVRMLSAGSEHVEVWDIVDRLLSVTPARGSAALEALLSTGVSPQQLMAVLARQFREILQAQLVATEGRSGSPGAVASELGLPPWQAERLARWAATVPRGQAEAWLRDLQRLDAETKLGTADDVAGMRSLALRAARDLTEARAPSSRPGSAASRA